MRQKIASKYEIRTVEYSTRHWDLLKEKREEAMDALRLLPNINTVVHGSIARGDISPESDIDIIILQHVTEINLLKLFQKFVPFERYIIQATPLSAIKAQISISSKSEMHVAFPLTPLPSTQASDPSTQSVWRPYLSLSS